MDAERRLSGRVASGNVVTLTVRDGRVRGIEPAPDNAAASWLVPGFVDLQVNGYMGLDVNGPPDPDRIARLALVLAQHGTTSWCPTIVTNSPSAMLASIEAVVAATRSDALAAHTIVGIHVEGPHISPLEGARGAHPVEHVRPPDTAELARWLAVAGDVLRIVTLSPEWEQAPEYVRFCLHHGVLAAIGHTAATGEQIRACADAGATLSTHLGNGAPATLPRHPNMIWAQLADDRLHASLIADGHHLPAETLKVMIRAKTPSRTVLVSDSVALAGLPPGEYESPIGLRVAVSSDGRISQMGTPYLAGAGANLAEGVSTLTRLTGTGLSDAVRMATANPSSLLGRAARDRGRLRPGAAADLVRFHMTEDARGVEVRDVLVAGRPVLVDGQPVLVDGQPSGGG